MDIYWLEQTEADVPVDNQWLSPEEEICLHSMRFPKRRTDWRLGRWTAKRALAACLDLPTDAHSLTNLDIHAAPSGAPEVFLDGAPAQVAISLSHRAGTALCTVGSGATNFGCDLEKIEPRSNAFIADYFTATEQVLIWHASPRDRPLLLGLLWSAKESALKALRVGLRLDTRSLNVSPGDVWSNAVAHHHDAWIPMKVHHSATRIFEGWWRVQHDLMRTIVSDPPLQAPRHAMHAHPNVLTASLHVQKQMAAE